MNIKIARRGYIFSTFAIAAIGGLSLMVPDSQYYKDALVQKQGISKPKTAATPVDSTPSQVDFPRPVTEKQKECLNKGTIDIMRVFSPNLTSNAEHTMRCS